MAQHSHFQLSAVLVGHGSDVKAVVAPTDSLIASGSRDHVVATWQREAPNAFSPGPQFKEHQHFVNALAFVPPTDQHPNGLIVSSGSDKFIYGFDPLDPSTPLYQLIGHEGNVCALATGVNGDVISGSWDFSAKVWRNWNCIYTLKHAHSVWAVLSVEHDVVLTGNVHSASTRAGESLSNYEPSWNLGSADKTIKLWREGKNVHTYTGHTDAVRGLALYQGVGFASCSNDSTIRLWSFNGDVLQELSGHTSFIYTLIALPTGELVSGGEDRTVRVWRGNECVQTISHPCQSMWSVCAVPNGDIVSAGSDGVVRVWTRHAERKADEAVIKSFDEAVASTVIPSNQVGDVDKSKLPGVGALQEPGKKDGEVKMVRVGNAAEAHQWSAVEGQWVKIGEVVDAVGSGRRTEFDGKEYDYVFDIDIGEGMPPLKLPYNVTENPYQTAQEFIWKHEIPQGYLDQIANFIIQNAKGVTLGSGDGGGAPSDPFTGGGRYVPGGSGSGGQQTGGDPFTGAGRYVPGGSSGGPSGSAPSARSGEASGNGGAAYLPKKGYTLFKAANVSAILTKLLQFNGELEKSMEYGSLSLQPTERARLETLLTSLSTPTTFTKTFNPTTDLPILEKIAVLWPASHRFPGLDVLRLVVMYTDVVVKAWGGDLAAKIARCGGFDGEDVGGDGKVLETNRMLCWRVVSNVLGMPEGVEWGWRERIKIILLAKQNIADASNKNLRVALATVFLNYAVLLNEKKQDDALRVEILGYILEFLKSETDAESEFRSLVTIGTLVHGNASAKEAAGLMDVKDVLSRAERTTGDAELKLKQVEMELRKQYVAELEELLKQVLGGVSAQAASTALEQRYYTQPQCIPALADIALRHPDAAVRNLSAVELRKQVKEGAFGSETDKWEKVDAGTREGIKRRLLEVIVLEPENATRHAQSRVISEIAAKELEAERWPELLGFLSNCCVSATASHREIGVYVLFTLFDVVGDMLDEHLPQLLQLFSRTLVDPESAEVRVNTLRALGRVADFLDVESKGDIVGTSKHFGKTFRSLIPGMLSVIQHCLDSGDEDRAVKGIEVFDNLLVLEAPVVTTQLPALIDFFTRTGSNKSYGGNVRQMSISFLMWATVCHKNKIQKLQLIAPIIAAMFPIASEDEEEDEDSPVKVALQVISSMSTSFAPTEVFPVTMKYVVEYFGSPDPRARKAAVLAVAVLVDGCADYMRSRLNDLLVLVSRALQDSEPMVRKAGCLCLSSLAEELEEEIGEHHATLVPLIFGLMSEPHYEIQKSATTALDTILAGLGDSIGQYLQPLMTKLVGLLDNGDPRVRGSVVACLGSAANASGDDFKPFFAELMPRMQHLMAMAASKDDLDMRGIATDAISSVAEAVGKDVFRPYLPEIMKLSFEGLHLESNRLRECTYIFFGVMARVFEEEFGPYLNAVVPQLIRSCELNEAEFDAPIVGGAGEGDDDENDDGKNFMSLHNAIAAEKESAVDALGQIFAATKGPFLPYVEPTVNILMGFLDHNHEEVRKSSVGSLFLYFATFYKMASPPAWVAGLPVRVGVHENVVNIAKLVMGGVNKMLEEETDRLVVAQTFNEFKECIKEMGPCIFVDVPHFDALANIVLKVIQQQHLCQIDELSDIEDDMDADGTSGAFKNSPRNPNAPHASSSSEEDDDDVAELDALLIEAAVDLVAAMAGALGGDFVPYFERFQPLIAKYFKKSRSSSDRNMVVGAFADVTVGIGNGVTKFTGELMPMFVKALGDEDEEVRANAAFAVGALVFHSQSDLTSYYVQVLQLLRPLIETPSELNAKDNACGAIARMILRSPDAIPLDRVLPALLQQLPLKRDYEENEPIYRCLFALLRVNNAYLLENMPQLLNIFAQVLGPPENQLKPATRAEMLEFLNTLKVHHTDQFQSMLTALQADYANVIINNLR
ncbi:hypothetical protein HDV00_010188 [Rhizophlyctis rosea]|nr:hypothetical protein HDV00_010188 [Rhizophlyctis rosea]